jgi:hypothetical protein
MRMTSEQLVEWKLAGETEVLRENLPQGHFIHDLDSRMMMMMMMIIIIIIMNKYVERILKKGVRE